MGFSREEQAKGAQLRRLQREWLCRLFDFGPRGEPSFSVEGRFLVVRVDLGVGHAAAKSADCRVGVEASVSGANGWRGTRVRRHEKVAGAPGTALVGRKPAEQHETFLMAAWTASRAAYRLALGTWFRLGCQKQLQTPECVAMSRTEQSVCAHAVQAFRGHVLQEAAQELVSRQRHALACLIASVAIGEGDASVVAGRDGFVCNGGAVHVAAEVREYRVGALHGGLCEDDARFAPGHVRKLAGGYAATSEMEKATAEAGSQCLDGHQEALVARLDGKPSASVRSERPPWNEHMQMWMPLERACPGVRDGECSDLLPDELWVCDQRREGIECCTEQDRQQCLLVCADDASKLRWKGEHDVKVGHWQHQLTLSRQPALGGVVSALRTRAMPAGVIEQVLGVAARAVRDVTAECRGPTACDGAQRADVTRQQARAEASDVVLAVLSHDLGQTGHGRVTNRPSSDRRSPAAALCRAA